MSTVETPPAPAPEDTQPPEPADTDSGSKPDQQEDALFDKAKYDDPELALPKVDGEGVDRIAIKVTGTVFLDRSDPRDVDLMRRMKLGSDVTLMVEGRVSKKAHGFTTDREGELDVIKLEHAINVHTVYRPAGD